MRCREGGKVGMGWRGGLGRKREGVMKGIGGLYCNTLTHSMMSVHPTLLIILIQPDHLLVLWDHGHLRAATIAWHYTYRERERGRVGLNLHQS